MNENAITKQKKKKKRHTNSGTRVSPKQLGFY